MNRALVVWLVLAAVLAGCNAPASSDPGSTLTPAPVPASDASADRLATGELAPGVEPSGVTDATRLAAAHADVLAASGYTVNQTLTQTYANGTVESRYVTRATFGTAPGRFEATLTQTDRGEDGLSTRTVERFADGTRVYEAVTEATGTRYRVIRGPDGSPRDPGTFYPTNFTNEPAVARLFTLVATEPTDRWVEDGTQYLRVESQARATVPPLRNVTLEATVAETGVVRDYRVEYDVVRGGTLVHVTVAVSYADVGEATVERPGWLDRVNASG